MSDLPPEEMVKALRAARQLIQDERRKWFCSGHDCDPFDHGRDEGFALALAALEEPRGGFQTIQFSNAGRVEIGSDDPLYKSLRPSAEAIARIERDEHANAAALQAVKGIMIGRVENWPEPKRFGTALALIDKTIGAALETQGPQAAALIERLEARVAELEAVASIAHEWLIELVNGDHGPLHRDVLANAQRDLAKASKSLAQGEG